MSSKPIEATERKVRFLPKKEGYASAYCNNTQIAVSTFDVRLDFGEIESGSQDELVIQPKISVLMSPQHAKAVLALLSEHVRKYEAAFGEIRIEPIG